MTVTIREFTRRFPQFRREALAGKEIQVNDRQGNSFVFKVHETAAISLAEAMGDLMGSVRSGQPKKSLEGYGRD